MTDLPELGLEMHYSLIDSSRKKLLQKEAKRSFAELANQTHQAFRKPGKKQPINTGWKAKIGTIAKKLQIYREECISH